MKEIAFKAKSATILLILGASLSALLAFLSFIIKPNGWIIYLSLFSIMTIIFIVSFCYELKKPNCLIKLSDDYLWIYAKKKWNKIQMNDVIDITYRRTQSGRTVTNSGTLKIITPNSSYTLYNIKNVESGTSALRQLTESVK